MLLDESAAFKNVWIELFVFPFISSYLTVTLLHMAKAKSKNTHPSKLYLKHNAFARDFIFTTLSTSKYKVSKHSTTTGTRIEQGIVLPDKSQLQCSVSGIGIHPEFLPYFFGVPNGCPQKLLLFIIFHVVEKATCQFPFNEHVCQQFINFCEAINPASTYKMDVVKKAIRPLVDANLVLSVERQQYLLNPLIISTGKKAKWSLINIYIQALMKKGKAVDANFLPKYGGK